MNLNKEKLHEEKVKIYTQNYLNLLCNQKQNTMNFSKNPDYETLEEGMSNLRQVVHTRDTMGGSLYWNALNEDACEIASKVSKMKDADKVLIGNILGIGNFR